MKKKKQRKKLKVLLLSMWLAAAACVVALVILIATNDTIMSMLFPTESHDVDVQLLYNINGGTERVPLNEVDDYISSGEWTRRVVTLYHPDKATSDITVREEDVETEMTRDSHWREDDGYVYLVNKDDGVYHIVKQDQAERYKALFEGRYDIEDYKSNLSSFRYAEVLE